MTEEEDLMKFEESLKTLTTTQLRSTYKRLKDSLGPLMEDEEAKMNAYEEAKRQRRIVEEKIRRIENEWKNRLGGE